VTTSHQLTAWARCPRPSDRAMVRLFCLPFGGGGASTFREWPRELWPDVEVWQIQLPGREGRYREPPFTQMDTLIPALADALRPYLTRPFVLFGHSMGALLSFELARVLRRRGDPGPAHLFVSARRAPQVPDRRPPLHALPDADLVEELGRRYNGLPRAVLESADLMRMFMPLVRADLTLTETYAYAPEAPLVCPISAFGGLDDGEIMREELAAWGDQTRGSFTLRMLSGGHFFLQTIRPRLLTAIFADLRQTLADLGPPPAADHAARSSP
jgi:medium-chain acyl-[acyl-carrier-protein] hydrolase